MVVRMAGLGRSFRGVAAYCLHDRRLEGRSRHQHPSRAARRCTRRGGGHEPQPRFAFR